MVALEDLKKTPAIYMGLFTCKKDVADEFKVELGDSVKILIAVYGMRENGRGEAFVLFIENDKLYEVHADHCSCYGLEYQWGEEETTLEAIEHQVLKGTLGQDIEKCVNVISFEYPLRELLGIPQKDYK